jgi:hypothetical protein
VSELLVFAAGACSFRFLRHSKQVPGRNGNPAANKFGLQWLEEWRQQHEPVPNRRAAIEHTRAKQAMRRLAAGDRVANLSRESASKNGMERKKDLFAEWGEQQAAYEEKVSKVTGSEKFKALKKKGLLERATGILDLLASHESTKDLDWGYLVAGYGYKCVGVAVIADGEREFLIDPVKMKVRTSGIWAELLELKHHGHKISLKAVQGDLAHIAHQF